MSSAHQCLLWSALHCLYLLLPVREHCQCTDHLGSVILPEASARQAAFVVLDPSVIHVCAAAPDAGVLALCRAEKYGESDWWQYARTKLFNLMTTAEEVCRF